MILLASLPNLGSCTILPSEFNLSPIYRHRLDEEGKVLELDFLWPIVHYEITPEGGGDLRIRPFYRRLTKPREPHIETAIENKTVAGTEAGTLASTEHQFLWPLGRVHTDEKETHARLFPLWSWTGREFLDGGHESDWYFLFPFFWGGSSRKGPEAPDENYFGLFPLYLDAPQFLTYDRFQVHAWPLHTKTEKDGKIGHIFLWPLCGYGYGEGENAPYWHRFLPFYNVVVHPGKHARYAVLWPFISWSTENIETGDPLQGFAFWPLFSWQSSEKIHSWSFLWPFFRGHQIGKEKYVLSILWPFFRYHEDKRPGKELWQWWLWPFVSRTIAPHQRAWSFLWPLVWWREYDDPDGKQNQEWVLPFYWHVHRQGRDGGEDDFLHLWPLWHLEQNHDHTGDWSFPSPWPWRQGNASGVFELYDFLWTLAEGRQRGQSDSSMNLAAHLYTTRSRGKRTQSSVPFLFSYESDEVASTLYLFQLIPIPFGGSKEKESDG